HHQGRHRQGEPFRTREHRLITHDVAENSRYPRTADGKWIAPRVGVGPKRHECTPDALAPWHMLLFGLIGFGFLVMGENRRIASIGLLRAEAMKSSLYRHAQLSIALCDQLN